MPCTDGPDPRQEAVDEAVELTAMLCGVLSYLTENRMLAKVLGGIAYDESGITEAQLAAWWHEHQEKDRERKRYEMQQHKKNKIKQKAIAKLTKEERKALGV
jgi:hypothetical protein